MPPKKLLPYAQLRADMVQQFPAMDAVLPRGTPEAKVSKSAPGKPGRRPKGQPSQEAAPVKLPQETAAVKAQLGAGTTAEESPKPSRTRSRGGGSTNKDPRAATPKRQGRLQKKSTTATPGSQPSSSPSVPKGTPVKEGEKRTPGGAPLKATQTSEMLDDSSEEDIALGRRRQAAPAAGAKRKAAVESSSEDVDEDPTPKPKQGAAVFVDDEALEDQEEDGDDEDQEVDEDTDKRSEDSEEEFNFNFMGQEYLDSVLEHLCNPSLSGRAVLVVGAVKDTNRGCMRLELGYECGILGITPSSSSLLSALLQLRLDPDHTKAIKVVSYSPLLDRSYKVEEGIFLPRTMEERCVTCLTTVDLNGCKNAACNSKGAPTNVRPFVGGDLLAPTIHPKADGLKVVLSAAVAKRFYKGPKTLPISTTIEEIKQIRMQGAFSLKHDAVMSFTPVL